jgi:DNA-binding transcriptional LysR family regulator
MDRIAALKLLTRLAERGSFTAAARDLQIKQSTASKWIAALEAELGAALVHRTTRSVAITEAGHRALSRAREVVGAYDELRADLAARGSAPVGRVRASIPVVFGRRFVVPAIAALARRHPELRVELVLSDRYVNLVEEGFDLAIRVGAPADTSARGRKLADGRRVVVAAPRYLRARDPVRHPSQLRAHECLLHGDAQAPAVWRFTMPAGEVVAVPVRGRVSASNSEAVLDLARAGLGVALLAEWLVRADLARGQLVAILEEVRAPPAPVYALLPPGRYAPAGARAVVDHLAATLAAQLAAPTPRGARSRGPRARDRRGASTRE